MERAMRPMSIWHILDRSVRLYRRHLRVLFGAAVIVGLAGYAVNRIALFSLQAYARRVPLGAAALSEALPLVLLTLAVSGVALAVDFMQVGVLAPFAGHAYVEGRVEAREALSEVPFLAVVSSCLACAFAVGAGLLVLVVPGLFFAVTFALVPTVAGLEGRGPLGSLRRSWELMRAPMPKGLWNNTVTRVVVIWGFVAVLQVLALSIWGLAFETAPDSWKVDRIEVTPWGQWQVPALRPWIGIGMDIFKVFIEAFFRPFGLCAFVLLYYDIRVRKEGFDIALLLDRQEGQESDAALAPGNG